VYQRFSLPSPSPRAGFGDKFKVKRQKPADSDERETLHYARTVIRPGDRILYIHSKGVSDARCESNPDRNPLSVPPTLILILSPVRT